MVLLMRGNTSHLRLLITAARIADAASSLASRDCHAYSISNTPKSISTGTSAQTSAPRIRQSEGSDEGSSNRTAKPSEYLVPDTVLFDLILEGPETNAQKFGSLLSMIRDFR
jgi:hypothetical protein